MNPLDLARWQFGITTVYHFLYTGSFLTLLNPYALLGGLTTLAVFTLHGTVFLALKTTGEIHRRARALSVPVGVVAICAAAGFLVWTQLAHGNGWTPFAAGAAALALAGGVLASARGREGWAFLLTATAIVATTVTLFGSLYPDVLPSTTDPAYSLTTANASSTPYTLKIMTWVAVAFTPIVLAYQSWTYWVFRRRVTREAIPTPRGASS
jgi:cytochrome bd ubiquinol oxidase subunit II